MVGRMSAQLVPRLNDCLYGKRTNQMIGDTQLYDNTKLSDFMSGYMTGQITIGCLLYDLLDDHVSAFVTK